MSTVSPPDLEPEVRDHFTSGSSRSQITRELRRRAGAAGLLILAMVIAGGVAFTLASNLSGGASPLEGRYEVDIAVSDASGIVPRVQEVRIAGVPVGRIAGVRLQQERPVVTLSILERYGHLFRDAKVRVRPQTPLNDLYVNVVDRGTPAAGRLEHGDVLPATATSVPVPIGSVLNMFDQPTRLRLQRFLDEFGPAIGDGGRQLNQAIAAVAPFMEATHDLTRVVAARQHQTRRLVRNLGTMLEALAQRDGHLRRLVVDGQRTLEVLGKDRGALDATLAALPDAVGQARTTFARLPPVLDKARSAFDALMPTAGALPAGLQALESFAADATPALRALQPTVAALGTLVDEARPLSAGLTQSVSDLRPTAPRLDRITKLVPPCEDALRNFLTDTISVFKFENGHTAYPRGELVANAPGQYVQGSSCAPGKAEK